MRVAAPRLNGKNLAAAERAARRRMIAAEGRERAAAEHAAVEAGVDETVALGEARGEAFTRATAGITRRHSGLTWLVSQGKLTTPQYVAAFNYGNDYRRVMGAAPLRSSLGDHAPGGDGPTLAQIMDSANATTAAENRMFLAARALRHNHDLLDALNVICGQEKTPREAGGNALGAAVITARLVIALDLLVDASQPQKVAA